MWDGSARRIADQLAPIGRREPGRWLVEQDEARGASERHADLELALLTVAQLRHRLVRHGVQMRHMRNSRAASSEGSSGAGRIRL